MQQTFKEIEKQKKNSNDLFSPRTAFAHRFKTIREYTETICTPLKTEDFVIQSMPDVSPAKWHLAHTSWFFETFVLKNFDKSYREFNPVFNYLFNSYYVQVGPRFTRSERGLLSRPTVEDVYQYRSYVNFHFLNLLEDASLDDFQKMIPIIELGLNHEQQHQELILTDIKHVFSVNPLKPVYLKRERGKFKANNLEWIKFDEGIYFIGHQGDDFAFDNEGPKHREFVEPFQISSRLITNGEFLEFIDHGGYDRPELWLSDGYAALLREGWKSPLYWIIDKDQKKHEIFTLSGLEELNLDEPVCHISFYEADAFARWKDCRLLTETEWEVAASGSPLKGNFLEDSFYHPITCHEQNGLQIEQLFGDLWEWTRSSYSPYPGYKTPPGAIGEYNGKFMSGQMVLRGGSCVTPRSHIRATYRNFFAPPSRWQFTGIRLAKDGK
ncbi:MAG: ergothioneine biosynthesis protein EgtB [Bacteroidota bacterium]|nr:ergothioneine biosynthesis protein EgtB [Bacteroidota bacterium]MDP4194487.1 ergothioneine biosynthesis protein EgtB [Bacteroidota bacterium]